MTTNVTTRSKRIRRANNVNIARSVVVRVFIAVMVVALAAAALVLLVVALVAAVLALLLVVATARPFVCRRVDERGSKELKTARRQKRCLSACESILS